MIMAMGSRGLPRFLLWLLLFSCSALPSVVAAAELVMFDEAGCVWCRRWDAEIGQAYPNTDEGRRAPLRRIDISRAASSGIKLATPVRATPTFVLVEAGAEVGRITGYPGADFFWGMLGELLARLEPEPPRRAPIEKPRDARRDGGERVNHAAGRNPGGMVRQIEGALDCPMTT